MRRAIVAGLVVLAAILAVIVFLQRDVDDSYGIGGSAQANVQEGMELIVEPKGPIAKPARADRPTPHGAGTIRVLVRADGGRAVEAAAVRIMVHDENIPSEAILAAEGITGGDGQFTATDLSISSHFVAVTKDNLAGYGQVELSNYNPVRTVQVLLRPCVALSGIVVDPSDQPVAGAEVWPVAYEHDPFDMALGRALAVPTNETGGFTSAALREGVWRFGVRAEGYPPFVSDPILTTDTNIVLKLRRGGALAGRCIEDGSGEPVGGLELMASGSFLQDPVSVSTAADGAFDFGELPVGTYSVTPGGGTWVPVKGHENIKVGEEEAASAELIVARGGSVRGRVYVRGTDEGVPQVLIKVTPGNEGLTNEEGYYEIRGLWPAKSHVSLSLPEGYAMPMEALRVRSRDIVVHPGVALEGMDFPVDRRDGPAFEGVVVDAQGAPLANMIVFGKDASRSQRSTRTDEAGQFVLLGFQPGDAATFVAQDDLVTSEPVGPFVLDVEGTRDIQIVAAGKLDCGMEGVVVLPSGVPADCRVIAQRDDGGLVADAAATDAFGRFQILGLRSGSYFVSLTPVFRDANETAARQAGAQVRALELTLSPGQVQTGLRLVYDVESKLRIAGRVVDEAGDPVASANVGASSRSGGTAASTHSAADGTFVLLNVIEGTYLVAAGLQDRAMRTENPVEVEAGTTDLVLVVGGNRTLTGLVLDSDTKEPVTRFQAVAVTLGRGGSITNVFNNQGGRVFANPEGRFEFELGRGIARVGVRAEGYRQAEVRVEADAQETVIELTAAGSAIEGVVRFSDGSPVPGAAIFVGPYAPNLTRSSSLAEVGADGSVVYSQASQSGAVTTSSRDGRFTIETWMLPEFDPFMVVAQLAGYVPAKQQANTQTTTLTLTLEDSAHLTGSVTMNGVAATQCGIDVHYQDGRVEEGYMRADGTFWLNELPAGQARVVATLQTEPPMTLEQWAVFQAGYETQVDFVFSPPDEVPTE